MVFEGAIPHKSSNRGAFNVRFAQPTRLSGTQHTETQFPGQETPQTWDVSHDPLAGITAGQLERCRKSETCPKITATVTEHRVLAVADVAEHDGRDGRARFRRCLKTCASTTSPGPSTAAAIRYRR